MGVACRILAEESGSGAMDNTQGEVWENPYRV